jgi:hypothetical protein
VVLVLVGPDTESRNLSRDILPAVNREELRPSGSRAQPDDDGASHTVGIRLGRFQSENAESVICEGVSLVSR